MDKPSGCRPARPKRSRYKTWMRLPVPQPPKSTRYRNRAGQEASVENVISTGVANAEKTPQVISPESQPTTSSGTTDVQHSSDCGSDSPGTGSCDNSHDEDFSEDSTDVYSDVSKVAMETDDSDASFHDDCEEPVSRTQEVDAPHPTTCEGSQAIEALNEKIHPSLNTTKFEALLMILNYSLRHGLTAVAREELCSMINFFLESESIHSSSYWFKKVFGAVSYSIHFYCSSCGCYICELLSGEDHSKTVKCPLPSCQSECNLGTLNDGAFFVTLPVRDQLQVLLENTENITDLLNYRWTRSVSGDVIADIFDGTVYKQLSENPNILSEKYNLSLTFNTDGAAVFKSRKNSLWPIHVRMNELPPNVRFDQANNLLAGLWFGSKEPDMTIFLSPFVKEMQELHTNGLNWKTASGGVINSKVVLLQCVVDSVAKAKVQNVQQFNGYWGCGYCLHPGVVIDEAQSNQAKYVMDSGIYMMEDLSVQYTVKKFVTDEQCEKEFFVKDRENDEMRSHMIQAESRDDTSQRKNAHVKGVKGYSALFPLLVFDLTFGFAVDYMHAVLLGVCRTVTNLWLDKGSPFFVGESVLKLMEERLSTITPPLCITRRPRPLSERIHWKANEWRAWLFYYSLPVSVGHVPNLCLKHHCLLVTAVYIFSKDSISREELKQAAWHLATYVHEFQGIYKRPNMFFNVHLLLHLGKMVNMYGPLWCYSAFSFESANGYLIKLVKGTKGVMTQISDKYCICWTLNRTIRSYSVSTRVLEFCKDLLCYRVAAVGQKVNNVTVLGLQKMVPLCDEEREALVQASLDITSYSYQRFLKAGVMYHARCYSRRGAKSDDTFVQLRSGSFAGIERIIISKSGAHTTVKVLFKLVLTERTFHEPYHSNAKASHIHRCGAVVYGRLFVEDAEEIERKAILMRCHKDTFVSVFPNTYEKD